MVTQQFVFFCSWSFWHAKSHFYWELQLCCLSKEAKLLMSFKFYAV